MNRQMMWCGLAVFSFLVAIAGPVAAGRADVAPDATCGPDGVPAETGVSQTPSGTCRGAAD